MDATSTMPTEPLNFEFSGKGWEYFKIWIVNILLTILTLGVYSAWAKVRNKQYFYSNTRLAGTAFEYTADPMSILAGRLIVFGVFLIYLAVEHTFPAVALLFPLVIFLAIPWLMVRGNMFNARYSNYRNISFTFANDIKGAVITFIVFGLLVVITAGLAFPFYLYRVHKFVVSNHSYGNLKFSLSSVWKRFYLIYLIALLIPVGMAVALYFGIKLAGFDGLLGVAQLATQGSVQPLAGLDFATMIALAVVGGYAFSLLMFLIVYSYIRTNILNTIWSNVQFGLNSFESNLKYRRMLWLYFSNSLMILLTLGLFTPWAKVRMARYRVKSLQIWAENNINDVIAMQKKDVSATGGEMSDFLDVDLAM